MSECTVVLFHVPRSVVTKVNSCLHFGTVIGGSEVMSGFVLPIVPPRDQGLLALHSVPLIW